MKDPNPHKLREEIKDLEIRLETRRNMLQQVVRRCHHDWDEVEYIPEHHKAYTIPADGRGSDWRPKCHVPAKTIKKWQRKCKKCGCKQITSRTKWVGTAGGPAGLGGKQEVPIFSSHTND